MEEKIISSVTFLLSLVLIQLGNEVSDLDKTFLELHLW